MTDTDAASPKKPPLTERLDKEATEALEAWLADGHIDKVAALLRRFICGISAVHADAPIREAFAIIGRTVSAVDDWARLDQQNQIRMLAAEALAMTGSDKLSEDFARQILAWAQRRDDRERSGLSMLGEQMLQAGLQMMTGKLGTPPIVMPPPGPGAIRAVKQVDVGGVTFTAIVDGKEIEHSYTSDQDLHLLLACPAPTGEVLKVWGRDPDPGPLAAGVPGPEPVFSALGFGIRLGSRSCLLEFHREETIALFLSEERPLGALLNEFVSRLSNPSPIADPDFFEVLEPEPEAAPTPGEVAL